MAILIDNAGTQHYANKMVLAENRKVRSKSLPSALADVDNLIEEMKGQFEAEYGSALDMKLENNENVFSVGTGSGIDRRGEVENSFTDIEIKGESLVNLVSSDKTSWTYSGIDRNTLNFLTTTTQPNLITTQSPALKPKTLYTCIYDISINKATELSWTIGYRAQSSDGSINTSALLKTFSNTSTHEKGAVVFTTRDTTGSTMNFEGIQVVFKYSNETACAGTKVSPNIMILEGDYTNKPLPQYFEGLKSVGEKENKIEVLSRGRVLFGDYTYSHKPTTLYKGVECYEYSKSSLNNYPIKPFLLKKGRKYRLSGQLYRNINNDKNQYFGFSFLSKDINYGDEEQFVYYWGNGGHSDSVINVSEVETCQHDLYVTKLTNINYGDADNRKVYLVKGTLMLEDITDEDTKYPYEPHKQDKKQISLSEPLRGIKNGVRDSIELINGEWKIVRRCGEVILNGSENWSLWSKYGSSFDKDRIVTAFGLSLPLANNTKSTYVVCDNFASGGTHYDSANDEETNHTYYTKTKELIHCYYANSSTNRMLGVSIKNSRLGLDESNWTSVVSLEKFKEWLQDNPTTVVFELNTPVIEDIDEITLQCWKNGTISIDEVLPVETTHTVALNKPAQIKRNIEELTELRNKVQALENQYDQIALEQAHKLELLNHSFELDYNI